MFSAEIIFNSFKYRILYPHALLPVTREQLKSSNNNNVGTYKIFNFALVERSVPNIRFSRNQYNVAIYWMFSLIRE